MFTQPRTHYLVQGKADGKTALGSFDGALRDAGVGDLNLIKVSSIIPPESQRKEGKPRIPKGTLTPVAYAYRTSSKPGQRIAAAIAIAYSSRYGMCSLIMEVSTEDMSLKSTIDLVSKMAVHGMRERDESVDKVETIGAECIVPGKTFSTVFAGVVLYNS